MIRAALQKGLHRVLLSARQPLASRMNLSLAGCALLTTGIAASCASCAEAVVPVVSGKTIVLESAGITNLFSIIRDQNTSNVDFSYYSDRLLMLISEEVLGHMAAQHPKVVQTPCGVFAGTTMPAFSDLVAVSIVRSGDILMSAMRKAAPGCSSAHILIQRDEADPEKRPKLFYSKLPPDITTKQVLLCDPMLATGGSAVTALRVLVQAGVKPANITCVFVVACPEGLARVREEYHEVNIVVAAVDPGLNDHKYIVPGLGDFGDRYYGTN